MSLPIPIPLPTPPLSRAAPPGAAAARWRAAACTLLLGALMLAPAAAATRFITLGSGSTAGLYYPTGEGLAKIVNDAGIDVRIGVRSTGGSVFNARAIQDGALQMAVMQNNIAYFAYSGSGIAAFAGRPTRALRGLATLYPEVLHIVARADSGIRTPADLRGRAVYVGDTGSGPEQDAIAVLALYGLTLSDLKTVVRGSAGNAVNLLRDGKIDALFYTVGVGSPAIVEAAQTTPITLVPLAPDKIAALHARHPYYTGSAIPADAYPKLHTATPAIAVKAMLVASTALPAVDVERILRVLLHDHLDALYNSVPNPNLKLSFKVDNALDAMPIPLHAGAVAFYKSIGIQVPAALIAD